VRQPLRVVLDTMLTCPRRAKVFNGDGALVFAAEDAPRDSLQGLKIERVARAAGGLDLDAVMRRLAALEVNELLLECGPTLAGAFIAKGLVDEFVLYVAPKLLGSSAAPLLHLRLGKESPPLPAFEFCDVQRIGEDVRLVLSPKKA
jgi:diaminohydroxyphosphoribosylaminopyrimidine deaminase/5-amino-6-(5-phosphoribosylamino)uracil reductase